MTSYTYIFNYYSARYEIVSSNGMTIAHCFSEKMAKKICKRMNLILKGDCYVTNDRNNFK